MRQVFIGLLLSFLVSFVSFKKKALSTSGFIAGIFMGTLVYFFGGIIIFVSMFSAFASSSVLSKFKKDRKRHLELIHEKSDTRDHIQIIVNCITGLIFSILYYFYNQVEFLVISATSFAVLNSDTWASEIGVLSKKSPISILTGKKIEKGMSGGVSLLGTISSLLGAMFVALSFSLTWVVIYKYDNNLIYYFLVCTLFGFLGSLIDSLFGLLLQAQYFSEELNIFTEKSVSNGKANKLVRGFRIFNNDMVNLTSSITSCLIAMIII